LAFLYTILLCIGSAWLLAKGTSSASSLIYRQKEALISVVLIWFITPAIGALPFIFSGTLENFDQAYFEAASGFTTTGATILEAKQYDPQTGIEIPIRQVYRDTPDAVYTYYGTVAPVDDPFTGKKLKGIEAVSRALLFWRSLMQWIGGMGIIVLFVAFLPQLGLQGKYLFQTEAPGASKEGFKPRIKETALQLWGIYFFLTLLQIILLIGLNSKITLFDAINLALATVSTGGFSIHNNNAAFYQNSATEWVIFIFMILGSVNFSLYYHLLKGKFYRLFEPELINFLLVMACLGCFIFTQIVQIPQITLTGQNLGLYTEAEAFRIALFQLVSAQTSTGFFLDSYDHWPYSTQVVLLIAMYLGGMSGSAAGGIKIIRLQVLLKTAKCKIESMFQPN
jgi:trk system potassium uptake protein TrkH